MIKNCPCCNENITFNEFYQALAKGNLTKEKLVQCPHCNKMIANKKVYDKYLIAFAIVVMCAGLFLDDNNPALFITVLSAIAFFIGLYKLIPFVCKKELN